MKRILKLCFMVLGVVLFSTARNPVSAQETTVSYQTFYDDLSPYGQWIDYPEYGYVWHPYVTDFRPYSSEGHWIWTDDYGWMWASDYEWGWAPFHYGRWLYDAFYGWVWIPGYEWSPAWVEWRTGGDYYGWAPLGPGINIGVNFSFGSYSPPYNYWCFVSRAHIMSPRVYDYCLPANRNTVIINHTTIINNYRRSNNVFVTGPRRNDVERYTGRINPFVLRQSSRPGRNHIERNTVNVFRPRIERRNEQHVTPRHFEKYNRQNGNAFKDRNNVLVNNERQRKIEIQRREIQNREQENKNVFERRQQDINRQNEMRRQQQQRNIEYEQQKNRNAFELRQNEMRKQQQQKNIEKLQQRNRNAFEQRQNEMRKQQVQERQQVERNNMQQRQNQMRQLQERQQEQRNNFQRRQTEMKQQQRNNSFQQRQQQHNNRNDNGKGHGNHGHH